MGDKMRYIILIIFIIIGLITPIDLIKNIFFDGPSVPELQITISIIVYVLLFYVAKIEFGDSLSKIFKKHKHKPQEKLPVEEEIKLTRQRNKKYFDIYMENKKYFDDFVKNIYPLNTYTYDEKFTLFRETLQENNYKDYDIELLKDTVIYVNKKNNYEHFKKQLLDNLKSYNIEDIYKNYITNFGENSKGWDYKRHLLEFMIFDLNYKDITYTEVNKKVEEYYTYIYADIRKQKFRQRMLDGREYSISNVDIMDGFEFEEFLLSLFIKMGYKGRKTQATNDQGGDLILEKLGQKTVVQAKCYQSNVGNKAIQEVVSAKAYYKCDRMMVVTNSYFTNQAKELARTNNVELIDRTLLEKYIERYY